MLITRPFVGRLTDSIGAKYVVMVSILITFLGTIPFFWFTQKNGLLDHCTRFICARFWRWRCHHALDGRFIYGHGQNADASGHDWFPYYSKCGWGFWFSTCDNFSHIICQSQRSCFRTAAKEPAVPSQDVTASAVCYPAPQSHSS